LSQHDGNRVKPSTKDPIPNLLVRARMERADYRRPDHAADSPEPFTVVLTWISGSASMQTTEASGRARCPLAGPFSDNKLI
jgi:hypothetical protein